MPTILIGGYYGAGNIGDEAILASIVKELRAQKPNKVELSIIVLSWDPEKTSRELDVGAILWNNIDALLDAVLKTDLIIVGGGGIFQDYWGFDPETYLRNSSRDISAFGSLSLLAKLLEIPCMIYAVGVGPFRSDLARYHTRLAFERCQVATVRDEESLEFLKQTGFDLNDPSGPIVKVLPDPVFSLTTSYGDVERVAEFLEQRNIEKSTPLLGVSLRHWDIQKSPEEWLSSVALGLRDFLEENSQVQCILIPFQVLSATPFTDDVPTLKMLADKLSLPGRIHLIEQPLDPGFVQALIGKCEVIIGMRLHSVIAAINVATPVVALSYAPKVKSVMNLCGLEEFCNPDLITKADVFTMQLQKAWDQRREISIKMQSIHGELSEKTKEHARLALDLLATAEPAELDFPKRFAIDQIRQLYKADQAHEQLRVTLQTKIWELQAVETDLVHQNTEIRKSNCRINCSIIDGQR
jgi:polysaccharide pyruvyl transferase CsaB